MGSNVIVYFIVGVVIGFISTTLFNEHTSNSFAHSSLRRNVEKMQHLVRVREIENQVAIEDVQKIRILCLINTHPNNHHTAAIHVQQTWGKHCNRLLFASTFTDVNLNTIGFDMVDEHDYVWGKEKLMLQYVYKNFFDHYDWFYKADDDSFANIENLRFLLSAYSTNDPIYFGFKYNHTEFRWGHLDGGAGNSNF